MSADYASDLAGSAGSLFSGRPAAQMDFGYFAWGLALWLAAAWAAWALRRLRRPVAAAMPLGILLAGSLNYAGGNITPLLSFIIAVLLLMALSKWNERELRWQAAGVDFAADLHADVGAAAIGVAISAVVLAGFLAYAPLPRLGALARQLSLRQAAEERQIPASLGLTSLPGEGESAGGAPSGPLPRSHLIGTGPELSSQTVFIVSTGEHPMTGSDGLRYYWRSLVFDQYTGSGWVSSPFEEGSFRGGEWATGAAQPAAEEFPQGFRIIRQFVQPVDEARGSAVLHAAGSLLAADRKYEVSWRSPPTSTLLTGYLANADAFGATVEGMPYTAISLLPEVSSEQLRKASGETPAWIKERYLQLPEGIPWRVQALALELTSDQPTAYDKATSIETYLRSYTYTLDLPPVPRQRDVVDYFLFDLRRGYCDYYASAMVVLARLAGLPARLVTGYASGSYDSKLGVYTVTAADAHSWAEIYFPGIGWVEFEPTAGQPALQRPEAASVPSQEAGSLDPLAPLQPRQGAPWLALLLTSLLLAGSLGFAAWQAADRWRLRSATPEAAITILFQRLYRYGRRLDAPGPAGETPSQFAAALQTRLRAAAASRLGWLLPGRLVDSIGALSDLYNQAIYSPRPPGEQERRQALRAWRQLGWRLWLARFGSRHPK
jgi:hypothetical protein